MGLRLSVRENVRLKLPVFERKKPTVRVSEWTIERCYRKSVRSDVKCVFKCCKLYISQYIVD